MRSYDIANPSRSLVNSLLSEHEMLEADNSLHHPARVGTSSAPLSCTHQDWAGRRSFWIALVALGLGLASLTARAQNEAVPAFKALDSMEARVQGCVTCHGQSGQGTNNGYYPRIAGKPAGYLFNQLAAFRDGTRKYPPMNYLLAYLPESYLREVANHFASLNPPFPAAEIMPAGAEDLSRGQTLMHSGDASKGIPACVSCHGERLTGMEPGIPGLVGLRPTYIVGQLTRWQVGDRHAAAPDCMKRVALRLSGEDISAVATWLARQGAPRDLTPESADLIRMPFACGSQPQM